MARRGIGARERLLTWGSTKRWVIATGMPRGWPSSLKKLVREGRAKIRRRPYGLGTRQFYTVVEYLLIDKTSEG